MQKLEVGQRLILDGSPTTVQNVWAQGRFHTHQLADGRTIRDVDAMMTAGRLTLQDTPAEEREDRIDEVAHLDDDGDFLYGMRPELNSVDGVDDSELEDEDD